jgi:hypothetical protein
MQFVFKFKNVDSGNYRIYYTTTSSKQELLLYCLMQGWVAGDKTGFAMLRCAKDGEPMGIVQPKRKLKDILELPPGTTMLETQASEWILTH